MDYYLSKLQQALALFKEPKVDIITGVLLLFLALLIGRANNTQAGTGFFLVLGIFMVMMGFFNASGGMWNF